MYKYTTSGLAYANVNSIASHTIYEHSVWVHFCNTFVNKCFVPLILEHSRKGGIAVVISHYMNQLSCLPGSMNNFHCSEFFGRGTILVAPNRLVLGRFLSRSLGMLSKWKLYRRLIVQVWLPVLLLSTEPYNLWTYNLFTHILSSNFLKVKYFLNIHLKCITATSKFNSHIL